MVAASSAANRVHPGQDSRCKVTSQRSEAPSSPSRNSESMSAIRWQAGAIHSL
jgi:hypothetical protein